MNAQTTPAQFKNQFNMVADAQEVQTHAAKQKLHPAKVLSYISNWLHNRVIGETDAMINFECAKISVERLFDGKEVSYIGHYRYDGKSYVVVAHTAKFAVEMAYRLYRTRASGREVNPLVDKAFRLCYNAAKAQHVRHNLTIGDMLDPKNTRKVF